MKTGTTFADEANRITKKYEGLRSKYDMAKMYDELEDLKSRQEIVRETMQTQGKQFALGGPTDPGKKVNDGTMASVRGDLVDGSIANSDSPLNMLSEAEMSSIAYANEGNLGKPNGFIYAENRDGLDALGRHIDTVSGNRPEGAQLNLGIYGPDFVNTDPETNRTRIDTGNETWNYDDAGNIVEGKNFRNLSSDMQRQRRSYLKALNPETNFATTAVPGMRTYGGGGETVNGDPDVNPDDLALVEEEDADFNNWLDMYNDDRASYDPSFKDKLVRGHNRRVTDLKNYTTENFDSILEGGAAFAGNLSAMLAMRKARRLTPRRRQVAFDVDKFNAEPMNAAIDRSVQTFAHNAGNKGADFNTYANSVLAAISAGNEKKGLNEMMGQKINIGTQLEKSKMITETMAANTIAENQADVDLEAMRRSDNKEKRAYMTAMAQNVSGIFNEAGKRKMAKNMTPFMEYLAALT